MKKINLIFFYFVLVPLFLLVWYVVGLILKIYNWMENYK